MIKIDLNNFSIAKSFPFVLIAGAVCNRKRRPYFNDGRRN
jgi:hypothetical protein